MSFTPCVYPMIPITLAVLGAQSQQGGVRRGFLFALVYGLGLALVYAAIGAISATLFSGITAYLQSPVVLVPIALLFVALSLAMFGAYELQAPAFLRDRLQGPGGNRTGVVGALVMGMVAGLVASPCVGPFLSALLLWVGATGSLVLGFWSLFVFGLGLSTLLILVGTFPAVLGALPRSGGWMETVRRAMGLLLLYMAFYFVRPEVVLPPQIFYPLLGAATVVVAVFLGAFDTLVPSSGWWDRTRKSLGLIALVVGLYLLGSSLWQYGGLPDGEALADKPALAARPNGGRVETGDRFNAVATESAEVIDAERPEHVPWEVVRTGEDVARFLAEKREEARASGRPLIIDFWATWCKFCLMLDKQVWNQPEVVQESLRFVTLKVDATESDDEMDRVWQEYRVAGLPAVVFIDSRGQILLGQTVTGFVKPEQMLARMRRIR
jgi:thiol:disulfide interchange protein DsbD